MALRLQFVVRCTVELEKNSRSPWVIVSEEAPDARSGGFQDEVNCGFIKDKWLVC